MSVRFRSGDGTWFEVVRTNNGRVLLKVEPLHQHSTVHAFDAEDFARRIDDIRADVLGIPRPGKRTTSVNCYHFYTNAGGFDDVERVPDRDRTFEDDSDALDYIARVCEGEDRLEEHFAFEVQSWEAEE